MPFFLDCYNGIRSYFKKKEDNDEKLYYSTKYCRYGNIYNLEIDSDNERDRNNYNIATIGK